MGQGPPGPTGSPDVNIADDSEPEEDLDVLDEAIQSEITEYVDDVVNKEEGPDAPDDPSSTASADGDAEPDTDPNGDQELESDTDDLRPNEPDDQTGSPAPSADGESERPQQRNIEQEKPDIDTTDDDGSRSLREDYGDFDPKPEDFDPSQADELLNEELHNPENRRTGPDGELETPGQSYKDRVQNPVPNHEGEAATPEPEGDSDLRDEMVNRVQQGEAIELGNQIANEAQTVDQINVDNPDADAAEGRIDEDPQDGLNMLGQEDYAQEIQHAKQQVAEREREARAESDQKRVEDLEMGTDLDVQARIGAEPPTDGSGANSLQETIANSSERLGMQSDAVTITDNGTVTSSQEERPMSDHIMTRDEVAKALTDREETVPADTNSIDFYSQLNTIETIDGPRLRQKGSTLATQERKEGSNFEMNQRNERYRTALKKGLASRRQMANNETVRARFSQRALSDTDLGGWRIAPEDSSGNSFQGFISARYASEKDYDRLRSSISRKTHRGRIDRAVKKITARYNTSESEAKQLIAGNAVSVTDRFRTVHDSPDSGLGVEKDPQNIDIFASQGDGSAGRAVELATFSAEAQARAGDNLLESVDSSQRGAPMRAVSHKGFYKAVKEEKASADDIMAVQGVVKKVIDSPNLPSVDADVPDDLTTSDFSGDASDASLVSEIEINGRADTSRPEQVAFIEDPNDPTAPDIKVAIYKSANHDADAPAAFMQASGAGGFTLDFVNGSNELFEGEEVVIEGKPYLNDYTSDAFDYDVPQPCMVVGRDGSINSASVADGDSRGSINRLEEEAEGQSPDSVNSSTSSGSTSSQQTGDRNTSVPSGKNCRLAPELQDSGIFSIDSEYSESDWDDEEDFLPEGVDGEHLDEGLTE